MTIDEYLNYNRYTEIVRINNHIKKQVGDEDQELYDIEVNKLGIVKCTRKLQ